MSSMKVANPSFASLNSADVRASSEMQTNKRLRKDDSTKLPAVRVRPTNSSAMNVVEANSIDPYQFNTP